MNNVKFKVNYIGKGIYRCVFHYEMKDGYCLPLVTYGHSNRQAIEKALAQYKKAVLLLL